MARTCTLWVSLSVHNLRVHGALVAHADDADVDALVGAHDGRIRLGAESHGSDRDARGAHHARFDKLSPVVVVRVHRVLAFLGLEELADRMRENRLFRCRNEDLGRMMNG